MKKNYINSDAKFIFVGNRKFVLEEMKRLKLNIAKIISVKGSFLERNLKKNNIEYASINTKNELLYLLNSITFDYLVLNGCPHIIPVSGYKNPKSILINVHPSYLPDLRGKDPVPGALLFGRDSGATCHLLDEGIDTGPIISRVKIDLTDDLDSTLLYQLSFIAEKEVFELAYKRNFKPIDSNITKEISNVIYYSKEESDSYINFKKDDIDLIIRKVKAFSNSSQGVKFFYKSKEFKFFSFSFISNLYLKEKCLDKKHGEVVLVYERSLIIKLNDDLLKLDSFSNDISAINVGDNLLADYV